MELKRLNGVRFNVRIIRLLIVPYGIETGFHFLNHVYLLLLIVPYGIETGRTGTGCIRKTLLIVPYGIETYKADMFMVEMYTFNRTLWN